MNGLNTEKEEIPEPGVQKIHVDENDPVAEPECPFETKNIAIKKDCWVTDNYEISDVLLGRGKFGEVKRCVEFSSNRKFAAKFVRVHGAQGRKDIRNEIEIMKSLQHPRLLQLYDAYEKRDKFCLVLELISGGELFERVINDDFVLTERTCVIFLRQICEGVDFIHSKNILHLDMKPENILCMTRSGNRIKIIDFGLARMYDPKAELRVLFGTPEFIAPEVVNFEPISPATDMWSVGVITYVLLSGLSPFLGEDESNTLANVTCADWDFDAEEFENISDVAKDFISRLLIKRPAKRMSAIECLEHKWLRESLLDYEQHLTDLKHQNDDKPCVIVDPWIHFWERTSKRENTSHERTLSKKRLRKFVFRRKWQKATNAMVALRRMGVKLV